MASEITEEEEDDHNPYTIQDKEAEKTKIRRIIDYQKSLYFSSSPSSSSSSSSATTSSKNTSLMGLMREGSTSLGRLFDMEHTTLANYFNDYSVSSTIKPILLWGSDTDLDEVHDDPWAQVTRIRDQDKVLSDKVVSSHDNEEFVQRRKRKLMRTKSYKRLPRFSLFRCGKFKFRLRFIRKLRVIIRGRIF